MKERIEKKLGCTIEEYYKQSRRTTLECIEKGVGAEVKSALTLLDDDEFDFVEEYIKNMVA